MEQFVDFYTESVFLLLMTIMPKNNRFFFLITGINKTIGPDTAYAVTCSFHLRENISNKLESWNGLGS